MHRREALARGRRAEDVAAWYFRLNGFLSIPGFVVHLDKSIAHIAQDETPRFARTEADLIGVRFVNSRERIFARHDNRDMVDDPKLTRLASGACMQALFILVEVKSSLCKMNGPWTLRESKNMQRVVRRLGFARDEAEVEDIADAMYSAGRFEDEYYTLQYICVGAEKNQDLGRTYPEVVQIDWQEIGEFMMKRFGSFPEKMPSGHVHDQWPEFTREYGEWFQLHRSTGCAESITPQAIERYVRLGSLD